jgi:hypothetical protein
MKHERGGVNSLTVLVGYSEGERPFRWTTDRYGILKCFLKKNDFVELIFWLKISSRVGLLWAQYCKADNLFISWINSRSHERRGLTDYNITIQVKSHSSPLSMFNLTCYESLSDVISTCLFPVDYPLSSHPSFASEKQSRWLRKVKRR